jgi:hypothetical protein
MSMKFAICALLSVAALATSVNAHAGDLQKIGEGAAAVGSLLDALAGKGKASVAAGAGQQAVNVPAGTAGYVQDTNRGVKFIAAVFKEDRRVV